MSKRKNDKLLENILESFKANELTKKTASNLIMDLFESEWEEEERNSGDFRDKGETQGEYFGKKGGKTIEGLTEKEKSSMENLLDRLRAEPLSKEREEFGGMLTRHIDSFTHEERKRYEELKEILKKGNKDE